MHSWPISLLSSLKFDSEGGSVGRSGGAIGIFGCFAKLKILALHLPSLPLLRLQCCSASHLKSKAGFCKVPLLWETNKRDFQLRRLGFLLCSKRKVENGRIVGWKRMAQTTGDIEGEISGMGSLSGVEENLAGRQRKEMQGERCPLILLLLCCSERLLFLDIVSNYQLGFLLSF